MSPASNLPERTILITGYNKDNQSTFLDKRLLEWAELDDGKMITGLGYVSKIPADLNGNADLEWDRQKNSPKAGLVVKDSAELRYIDLAPGYTCMMHRTKSVDYGIVLEGKAECIMGGGDVQEAKAGDCVVQRYTKHAWRNTSDTEWARIVFVLMDCKPLNLGGQTLKEDLGWGAAFVPPSGNDA